ncbi:MAG: Ig-like domain-containing protein, partial [Marinilabilia sp.]
PTTIEEDESTTLTATLSNPTSEDVTVTLATNDISTSQDDYDLSSNSITIDAGETEGTTTLSAIDDGIYEEDEEVEVSISEVDGGSAYLEEPQSVTITIEDAQEQPQVTLSADPLSIEEGNASTLTASLSTATFEDVEVSLDTNDISTNQEDYELSSNTITIEAGETSGTATLTATDDDIYEGDEQVEVYISEVEGGDAYLEEPQAVTITIEDAQEQPSVYLQLTGSPFSEDGGTAAVNILLSHPSAQGIRADLSYAGTASEEDYSGASSSVNFPAGSTQETILLTGEDNLEADGDRTIVISIASATNATIGDDNSVTATILDDDIAGITPIISEAGTITSETGTQDTFELVLNTQPASDVVLEIGGLDTTEGQLSTQQLTFTSENWDQPQVVTITGVDDDEVDGDIQYTLTIAVIDDQSDNAYHGLSTTIDVINTDNDNAALIVAPENESLQTSENETSDDFTIELSARPTSNVVINMTGLDETEGSLNTDEITFTPDNWDEPQTVTVTGVNDDLEDGDISYTLTLRVVEDQSDETFHGLSASVEVLNADNDNAELITEHTNDPLQTSEDGASDHFTIELNNQPISNVVINISGLDETEGSLSVAYITFTPDNWNNPRTVTVTGVDDNLADGDIFYNLTLRVVEDLSEENFHGLSASIGVVNADNENAELIVEPANDPLQTSEDGASDSFTIELNNQPTSNVVINMTGLDETEGSLNTDEISFTPDNWNEPQTVTVTGVNDDLEDGDITYSLTLTVVEDMSDEFFHGLSATIDVLNADNNSEEQENHPPSPADDEYEVDQNTTLTGRSLLSNDSDPDDDDLFINTTPVNQPANGTLDINEDGTFSYTPDDGFVGTESFTYEVCDNGTPPLCGTAVVFIKINKGTTELEVRDGFSPQHGHYIIPWLDEYDKVSLVVFNRWGKVVYSKDKYENNWSGESNKGFRIGNKLPVGTYYYVITIADNNKKLSGYIYLTR